MGRSGRDRLALLVEVDPVVGLDLADALEAAGCGETGPIRTAAEADARLARWTATLSPCRVTRIAHLFCAPHARLAAVGSPPESDPIGPDGSGRGATPPRRRVFPRRGSKQVPVRLSDPPARSPPSGCGRDVVGGGRTPVLDTGKTSVPCLVCESDAVRTQLDAGDHPVSSFFLTERSAVERTFRLALGQCERCGTIQSTQLVPHDALVAPYDWLFAREPEDHLDAVVEQIIALPGIHPDCVIGALTYKDDTTVDRFRKRGFSNTWRVKLDDDLGVPDPAASIETVQKLTTPDRMARIARRHGAADVLIVRHILEHAEDVRTFIGGIAALVKPGGVIMVEVPDCTTSLRLHDYCMVWEEHALYLTPASFAPLLAMGGFEPIRTDIYPIPFENSMVQLARKVAGPGPARIGAEALAETALFASYCADLDPSRRAIRDTLTRMRAEKGGIALFGAGHLACAFVNILEVGDLIDFVADDTPQKQGKFLPGARLPILPSAALVEQGIAVCLLALSIKNEDAVIGKNRAFVDGGGTFRSIFRASPRSIFAETP